jgi:hypothetical protein
MEKSFRNTLNILFLFNMLVIYGTCTKGWAFFMTHSVEVGNCAGALLEWYPPLKGAQPKESPLKGAPTKWGPTQGSPYSMGCHSRGPHSRKPPLNRAHTQRVEALLSWGSLVGVCLCTGPFISGGPPFCGGPGQLPLSPMPKSGPEESQSPSPIVVKTKSHKATTLGMST